MYDYIKRRFVMGRAKNIINSFLVGMLLIFGLQACSSRQDNTNFEKFLNQDTTVQGKAGVLITSLGQPEDYDYVFFDNYLNQIFNAAFPWYLKFIIMGDRGTVLRDPNNLFAQEEFKPTTLMDCFGNTANADGTPYAEMDVEWIKPRQGSDGGHFILKQKNEYVDIAEKTAIKIVASYYGRMPGKKIPYMQQHEAIFDDVKKRLAKSFPDVPFKTAEAMYPETVEKAINELIAQKVETIVVSDLFPVYSNLEEFNALFVEIEHRVAGRAKIIFAPSIGAFPSFRNALVQMARDEVAKITPDSKKLLVLTRHGFPEMPGEPYHKLAPAYYDNLQSEVEAALKGTSTDVVFADTEFSGEDDDPDNKRLSSAEALEMGLEKKYDHIVFILVDFLTENTDTVYCAREEALEPIEFEYEGEVPYTDFSRPFRTELTKGGTKITIAGTPVGPLYRPLVVQGIYDALTTVLEGKEWPQLTS
jgi:protoheme ferro-lyase